MRQGRTGTGSRQQRRRGRKRLRHDAANIILLHRRGIGPPPVAGGDVDICGEEGDGILKPVEGAAVGRGGGELRVLLLVAAHGLHACNLARR